MEKNKMVSRLSELSQEQSQMFNWLENTNDNYLIIGKAGTGKTTLLKYFIKNTKKKAVVLAFTGIAAINAGGQTIHSFFHLPLGLLQVAIDERVSRISLNESLKQTLNEMEILVIDEISMVRADIMDTIDKKMRYAREIDKPFGGCQVAFFGDLYQLPPVAENLVEKPYLIEHYGTTYFFGAPAIDESFFLVELNEIYRQKDIEFINILNKIRNGEYTQEDLDYLNTHAGTAPKPEHCPVLVLKNITAETMNKVALNNLPGPLVTYNANIVGGTIKSGDCPCEIVLSLKVGAFVIMIRNDPMERFVNGSLGVVKELKPDEIIVEIDGQDVEVCRHVWEKYAYERIPHLFAFDRKLVGSIEQFPIKLAYAVTVHKSQGQTYNDVVIDYSLDTAFTEGQTYVALSRCKSLERIHLAHPIRDKDIIVSKDVINFINMFESTDVHVNQQSAEHSNNN